MEESKGAAMVTNKNHKDKDKTIPRHRKHNELVKGIEEPKGAETDTKKVYK